MRRFCAAVYMVRTEENNNPAQPGVAKIVAACFTLSAFAIATLAGLFGGNDAMTVLLRALLAVMVCYPVGFFAGVMADMVIREQLAGESRASAIVSSGTDAVETSTPSKDHRDHQRTVNDG